MVLSDENIQLTITISKICLDIFYDLLKQFKFCQELKIFITD